MISEFKRAKRELKKINDLGKDISLLSDQELRDKTLEFKKRLTNKETLASMRVEVFAVAREAISRVLKKRLYDVQVLGGLILSYGLVAEMKTGEGKTITSILPVYLNALSGEGVLVSTVNEYLTERDATENGQVYNWLGLTIGINKRELSSEEKRIAYAADVTYSVHSEIGFDYLRDNMVDHISKKVQRKFNFCLIDEIDSILIDEAKTPLIITGGGETSSKIYLMVDTFVKTLTHKDFTIDQESKTISLKESGISKANNFFKVNNFYDIQNSELVHRTSNALRAHFIMFKDTDYIVKDEKIELIDAFTGRIMEGRSYADGLHQAIQAKEKVKIEPEMQTLSTITYQNLFRMFKQLCGMTGTAKTEEEEFIEIYNMRVVVIPTNEPLIRVDHPDAIFLEKKYKYQALVQHIEERNKKGQPILVGTEEISESEKISQLLTKHNIKHIVLNAKQNAAEADIIAKAGQLSAVTIATNMAGRGTDIKLSKEAIKAGGLYVMGTSKAESRRIDNQLRGRSGRQGDIGESKFFLSLQDTLISRFSNQSKLIKIFSHFKDKQIKSKQIMKALNRAQVKIEGFNYDSRKNVLHFDDVIRQQRDLIYAQRDIIIGHDDLIDVINRMINSVIKDLVITFPNFKRQDGSLDLEKMIFALQQLWFKGADIKIDTNKINGKTSEIIVNYLTNFTIDFYKQVRFNVVENTSEEALKHMECDVLLRTFDDNWKLHIDHMTKLRTSSSLASYAQKNPFQVYVEEGAKNFDDLLKRISHNTIKLLMGNQYGKKIFDSSIEGNKSQEHNAQEK